MPDKAQGSEVKKKTKGIFMSVKFIGYEKFKEENFGIFYFE